MIVGNVGKGLDVVQVRRHAPETARGLGQARRTGTGHAALAFDGGDERRGFAADKGAGAFLDLHREIEAAAEDVLAQQAHLLGLLDGNAEVLHRQRIFMPHIDVAVLRADGVGIDDHALDDGMRIAFHQRAVHERARIAFVAVADDGLDLRARFLRVLPFEPGGEACAAAPAQARFLDDIDHFVRLVLGQHFARPA